jgi:iron-sulfur cluster assembly accessory protein
MTAGAQAWPGDESNGDAVVITTDVTLSESAAKRIGAILKSEPTGSRLRVSVEGGGCSGFRYEFGFEQGVAEDDVLVERNGVEVLIDPVSLDFLRGSEIDFVDELIGSSFQIRNPNASSSCGCGTSFAM